MDKTMEIVLVAMVLMVSAVIIIAMANTQIGGFGETINEQRGEVNDNLSDQIDSIAYENEPPIFEPASYNSRDTYRSYTV